MALLNDLYAAFKSNASDTNKDSEYRIGSVFLCDHKDDIQNNDNQNNYNQNNDQYDIVDGQQRTTTLLIIFHVIMNLIAQNSIQLSVNKDNSTDSKEILPNLKYKEASYEAIVSNRDVINRKLRNINEELENFAQFILGNLSQDLK